MLNFLLLKWLWFLLLFELFLKNYLSVVKILESQLRDHFLQLLGSLFGRFYLLLFSDEFLPDMVGFLLSHGQLFLLLLDAKSELFY